MHVCDPCKKELDELNEALFLLVTPSPLGPSDKRGSVKRTASCGVHIWQALSTHLEYGKSVSVTSAK